ncbi:MAG: NADH-quinone oxidoreductase subunit C [Coriobacteriales bacterium]|jgi:NADH:ubiquinone oxidoreductase subunit C|nr:NADH-quinone oxidoreductase subunit C [Coriobacteriales bacterium]
MLINEEEIAETLAKRFPQVTVRVQRERRIWLDSPRKGFIDVLTCLHDELGFVQLCTVTGLDSGDKFELIYHLAQDSGIVMNARVSVPRNNPVFDTATNIYKGGILYELEPRNLLGLKINGLPEDIRYPLPDNWPRGEYPLRKDWVAPTNASDDGAEADDSDDDNPTEAEE